MKAEERHRLQENDLQRFAEHARERTRPFFDRYGVTLLLGLAAVLIVIAAAVWWSNRRTADRGEGWEALAAAFRSPNSTAEDFGAVADAYPESRAAVWARLYEGEARLGTGIESLFSDKEGAMRDLSDAQAAFESVLEQPQLSPEVAVRGLYGLARVLEATSDGDLQPAIERYEQIVNDYPGTVYEPLAQQRLDALATSDAQEFYAWFAKAQPTLQDPLLRPQDQSAPTASPAGGLTFPTDGFPSDGPAFPADSPGIPTESPVVPTDGPDFPAGPSFPMSETPTSESPAGETPAAGEPADGDAGTTAPVVAPRPAAAGEPGVGEETPDSATAPSADDAGDSAAKTSDAPAESDESPTGEVE